MTVFPVSLVMTERFVPNFLLSRCGSYRFSSTSCLRVTDDGHVVLHDASDGSTPFNLPLSLVLGDMPSKKYNFTTVAPQVMRGFWSVL